MKRLLRRLRRPVLALGLYRLHGGRVWSDDELTVVWHGGRWCVVPKGVRHGSLH